MALKLVGKRPGQRVTANSSINTTGKMVFALTRVILTDSGLMTSGGFAVNWLGLDQLFEIVHEDDGLLVVNKPAGLVCHPTKGDEYSSLISRARLHLGADTKPQLVNRLDRETSGVVLIAKTEEAAKSLRKLWEKQS